MRRFIFKLSYNAILTNEIFSFINILFLKTFIKFFKNQLQLHYIYYLFNHAYLLHFL